MPVLASEALLRENQLDLESEVPGSILKARSHCDGNGIFSRRCHCHHECFQYPFMTAMATEKMGTMESSDGVHTVAVTATEKTEFSVRMNLHFGQHFVTGIFCFHVVKPLMPILALLPISSRL